MFEIRLILLKWCMFGAFISLSGATVTLKTIDGQTSFQNGSTVQLVCTINPYNGDITWFIDNVDHAGCFLGNCNPYANKPHSFTYNFNESAGIFILTIDKVNFSHADLEFACDDGNERKTIKFNVTTDNEQNGSERSNGGNGDIGKIVGGIVGGVALFGAVSLIGVAGYKRYKKFQKHKEIVNEECTIGAPIFKDCTVTSTQVTLSWTQPYWNGIGRLKYNVILNQDENKTYKTSHTIHDLIPGKEYTVKVYTLYGGQISLPLERTVTTSAVTVSQEDVCFEPAESFVKCNIKWTVRDFVKPKPFKESDKFEYNVICYLGKKIVHASETIKDLNYTVPELDPTLSYKIYVYVIYHSEKLKRPCKIEIEAPYKLTYLEADAKSTLIVLKWKKPVYTGIQNLEYEVFCDGDSLDKTALPTYTIHDLIPGKTYAVKVYTLYEGLISLPFEKTVTTPAVTVIQEDVCFEPSESCVKCNIKWTVRDFVKPKPFKESDKFEYNVICYLGKKIVHASETIKDLNYTVPELDPALSYKIYVNAIYHSEKLAHPCKIEIEAPYKLAHLEAEAKSTLIVLNWKKPVYTGIQNLEYKVVCDGDYLGKTDMTTYTIHGLTPGKAYAIKVYTLYEGLISLPFEKTVTTPAAQPKTLPPLKFGQPKALSMEMSNSAEFVSEEGFAQNRSNRHRRNNPVNVLETSTN